MCPKCGSHNCCRREIQTGWHNDHQDATLGCAGSETRFNVHCDTVIEGPLLFFLTPQLNLLFLAESMKYTEWVDAFVACCPVPSFRSVFCWDGVAVTFHCSPWSKTTTHPYTARFYRHCKYWCLLPVLERTLFVACLDCFLACTGHSIGVESPYMSVVSPLRFLWLIETYWDILRHIETYWDILRHIETYWDMIEKV